MTNVIIKTTIVTLEGYIIAKIVKWRSKLKFAYSWNVTVAMNIVKI